MEQDRIYVLQGMKKQVVEMLRDGYTPQDRPLERMFQILCESSFGEDESWEVFKSKDNNSYVYYFVVKSTWEKALDNKKLDTPLLLQKIKYNKINLVPTIKCNRANVDEAKILAILYELENIKISPVPKDDTFGCDGNSYELIIDKIFYKSHFKWWEDGVSNWSPMTTLVQRILDEIRVIMRDI